MGDAVRREPPDHDDRQHQVSVQEHQRRGVGDGTLTPSDPYALPECGDRRRGQVGKKHREHQEDGNALDDPTHGCSNVTGSVGDAAAFVVTT